MARYVYEFGRRWRCEVPRWHLSWYVESVNVATTSREEFVADIAARIEVRLS